MTEEEYLQQLQAFNTQLDTLIQRVNTLDGIALPPKTYFDQMLKTLEKSKCCDPCVHMPNECDCDCGEQVARSDRVAVSNPYAFYMQMGAESYALAGSYPNMYSESSYFYAQKGLSMRYSFIPHSEQMCLVIQHINPNIADIQLELHSDYNFLTVPDYILQADPLLNNPTLKITDNSIVGLVLSSHYAPKYTDLNWTFYITQYANEAPPFELDKFHLGVVFSLNGVKRYFELLGNTNTYPSSTFDWEMLCIDMNNQFGIPNLISTQAVGSYFQLSVEGYCYEFANISIRGFALNQGAPTDHPYSLVMHPVDALYPSGLHCNLAKDRFYVGEYQDIYIHSQGTGA